MLNHKRAYCFAAIVLAISGNVLLASFRFQTTPTQKQMSKIEGELKQEKQGNDKLEKRRRQPAKPWAVGVSAGGSVAGAKHKPSTGAAAGQRSTGTSTTLVKKAKSGQPALRPLPQTDFQAQVRSRVWAALWPRNCSTARALVFDLDQNINGFGAALSDVIGVASFAVRQNRTLVFRGRPRDPHRAFWYARHCLQTEPSLASSWECFFVPPACTETSLHPLGRLPTPIWLDKKRVSLTATQRVLHVTRGPSALGQLVSCANLSRAECSDRHMAWRSQLLGELWRPRPGVCSDMATAKRRMGWPAAGTPVIGLHVRRSDKVSGHTKEGQLVPVAEFMAEADKLRRQFGVRHIFLATDEARVKAELVAAADNFTVLFDAAESRSPGCHGQ